MKALDWLYGLQMIGVKLGLENMRRLLATLETPELPPLTFHVAGTNGKGSVCAFLDRMAQAHDLRTGLFTSPHLIRFQERIRVNGELIPDEALVRGLDHLRKTVALWEPHPSFFEVTLALAMAHFYEKRIDCLVLETGLGGRLDASNAIAKRHVCVITPIHYDHMHILGNTLGEIAREKAGIFRPGVPVVSAAQLPEAEIVLRQVAAEVQAPIRFVEGPYHGEIQLAGEHQRANAALAREAFKVAYPSHLEAKIQLGLRQAQWPGRFQRFGDKCIVDGAHNLASLGALCTTWRETMGASKATVIYGCAQDKCSPSVLEMLGELAARFVFVPILSGRSTSPETFLSLLESDLEASGAKSLESALALANTFPEPVLITGSLFLAGQAIAQLTLDSPPLPTDQ